MNATSVKKEEQAAPTGRRYKSVADLIKGEGVAHEVGKQVTALASETGIVRQLVQLRVRAGLTQAEIAKRIGCTQSRISKMEASRDSDLTLGNLRDYMKATGSRINIVCGKPISHVEAVKMHAFSIKRHLEMLAEIAQKHDELEPHIQGFFGEAFFNILSILSECHEQMPKNKQDFELSVTNLSAETTTPSRAKQPVAAAV